MRVYAAQTAPVIAELERTGRCFCREEYIREKYGECADGFLIGRALMEAADPGLLARRWKQETL